MDQKLRTPATTQWVPHRRFLSTRPEEETAQQSSQGRVFWDGLYAGEPETCRRRLHPFLLTCAHMALLFAVFKVYRVEGRAFQILAGIAMTALPVHYLLPYRWKKPFFISISLLGLFSVFGTQITAIVLGLASLLIGVCYLPIAWKYRAMIMGGLTLLMAFARPETVATAIPDIVWPVLASIFMFRMMIYMYELKHAKKRETLVDTLSYFFLLPNSCFMHFPVVDYRTLQRGYFASDVHAIQRRGLQMMFRGTLHLLAYRLIYHHDLMVPPTEVQGLTSLLSYLACNYLLYLRVSGQFHMACGMLHLYGYQLPETHHHFLLATGFTDYWRRINIYWKDFMVRLFFNPVVFRLKRWPQPAALAVATAVVFVTTWALHAYQSYWLRGTWGFSLPDTLFWGILGALVMINVQLDARRSRKRKSSRADESEAGPFRRTFVPYAIRSIKTGGTLLTITLLWSLWSSPSVSAWLDLIGRGFQGL
jgi:hypothetical protein